MCTKPVRNWHLTPITGAIVGNFTPSETIITPPDTIITPTVVSAGVNSLSVSFAGVVGTNEISAFECRLDNGQFQLCVSQTMYDGLNNGLNCLRGHDLVTA